MDPIPMLREAAAAAKCGDLDDALVWARKAEQYAPKYAEAHIELGHLQEANRNWKAAYLQYERALDLDHNKRVTLETPMLRSLLEAKEYEKAEKLSLEMIKQFKKEPDCYYNRAWVLSRLPSQDGLLEAINDYRQVLALDPKREDARFNLALLLAKNEQKDAACLELKKFIANAPNDPDCEQAKKMLAKLQSTMK